LPLTFVDASYYLAAILPRDRLRTRALELTELVSGPFVPSDAVLIEVFDRLAEYGEGPRRAAVALLDEVRADPAIEIVRLTTALLNRAVGLYAARLDKGYSLTDCISMIICNERRIREVLTHDHHFEQEGFVALMRSK